MQIRLSTQCHASIGCPAGRTWYTRLTWGMQEVKLLVEMTPFPPINLMGRNVWFTAYVSPRVSKEWNYVKVLIEESVC